MKLIWMLAIVFAGTIAFGQEAFPPTATMKQVMVDLVYPASNEILLSINRGGPTNDNDWAALRRSAMALAESGNLLMMRGRVRDQGEWMKDVKLLVDAGTSTYKAAQAKDPKALAAVAGSLDMACLTCHKQYRPEVFPRGGSK